MTDISTITLDVKALTNDSAHGDFEAILSTNAVDRDGEVVQVGALKPLPKSIPIYYSHDWRSGAMPVAKAAPFYDGDVLKATGTYASTVRGQEMRSLVTEGIVDSMSIGFVKSASKDGIITKGELIEASFTGIPSNVGARVLASKALDEPDPEPSPAEAPDPAADPPQDPPPAEVPAAPEATPAEDPAAEPAAEPDDDEAHLTLVARSLQHLTAI